MAGTLNVTTISGASTITGVSTLNAASGVLATQNGMTGIAKAWVNFAGATGTINGSFNVSSVTRNGTGDYSVNFTTAMPNANYAGLGMGRRNSATQRAVLMVMNSSATYDQFTTYARFYTMLNDSATVEDAIWFNYTVLGA
jgi:hypothetical protein